MIEIKSKGLEELIRATRAAGNPAPIKAAVRAAALYLKRIIAEYPPQRHGPQPFTTLRQRRYFFWALRHGKIQVPYRRGQSPGSESLKHRWTIADIAGGYGQRIGNNASYAQVVQGRGYQSHYHSQTGWPVAEDVAEAEAENVAGIVADVIVKRHLLNLLK